MPCFEPSSRAGCAGRAASCATCRVGRADGHDACMPPSDMQSIIRQNANRPVLPDFRNLGTVLRILLAVNAGAGLYAFARSPLPPGLVEEWTNAATVVEPYLFLVLAVLYVASAQLAR